LGNEAPVAAPMGQMAAPRAELATLKNPRHWGAPDEPDAPASHRASKLAV